MEKIFNIAIDGPAGSGKSTIAKKVAKDFKIIYLDTGALYRTIGYFVYKNNCDSKNKEKIISMLEDIDIKIKFSDNTQHVFLNGEDVSDKIRTPIMSIYASDVSTINEVREFLLFLQKDFAKKNSLVMDGRDIGTVILPDADLKFLDADVKVRAKRRFDELILKGEKVVFDDVLKDMEYRDFNDSNRKTAPLKKADDAILIDTTNLNLDEVFSIISDKIRSTIYGA